MAGSKKAGRQTAETNKSKYGEEYYATIGAIGGSAEAKKPKGLAALSPERRREIAAQGGKAGKGKPKKSKNEENGNA